MKKKILKLIGSGLLAISLMMSMSACKFTTGGGETTILKGDLQYTESELKQQPFTEIDIETVADVYYTQTNSDKQEVRLDFSQMKDMKMKAEFEEKVKVVYRKGKMIIGLSGRIKGFSTIKDNEHMRVYVTSPDLVKVSLEGIGSFSSDSINSDILEIDNEGVGNISIKSLLANKVKITNEGVGSVNLGKVKSDYLSVDLEGVGSVDIDQFNGGILDIDSEGVGKVSAHVDCQKVNATLEGVGSIKLSGVTRELNKRKDGVGSLKISDLKVVK